MGRHTPNNIITDMIYQFSLFERYYLCLCLFVELMIVCAEIVYEEHCWFIYYISIQHSLVCLLWELTQTYNSSSCSILCDNTFIFLPRPKLLPVFSSLLYSIWNVDEERKKKKIFIPDASVQIHLSYILCFISFSSVW